MEIGSIPILRKLKISLINVLKLHGILESTSLTQHKFMVSISHLFLGYGEAEIQIGKALKALNVPRHHFVLSTKLISSTPDSIPTRKGLSRKHIIEGVKNSLKRLEFSYVDLLFCHRPDPETPMEEICRAMDWVIRKGLVFYWGTRTTIWSPLLSGILTGKYNNGWPEGNRFEKNPTMKGIYDRYFTETKKDATIEALNKFGELAKSLDCSMAQLALAWCINNPDVSTALTGVSSSKQLHETVKALDMMPKLTKEIEERIEEIFKTSPEGKKVAKTFLPGVSRRKELFGLK